MPSKKIVHLTSLHRPFDTRIFYKEAKTLRNEGYTVVIIAPDKPGGQVVEEIHLKTIAVASNRFIRFTHTLWQVYRIAQDEKAALYHFHDPELLLVGLLLSIQGKIVIYDVHEDVPRQILYKHWIPRVFRRLVSGCVAFVERIAAWKLSGIVAATPHIAQRFPSNKTVVVQNFPLLDELTSPTTPKYTVREPVVVYHGVITVTRGVKEIVQAMALLSEDMYARLVLVGEIIPHDLEMELRQMPGGQWTEFMGWQSRDEIKKTLSKARIGLVTLHPTPSYLDSYPVKLFEYMTTSLPVIASDFPLWREIVHGAGCGLLVDPLDAQAIAHAIAWLLEHPEEAEAMGKHGRQAVENCYNWEFEGKKLLEFYEKLLSKKALTRRRMA
ncbi:MAG: glycosyltransferase family 4 protein [Anaerolineae bacterium]|nr:glycosyltransferase family 4 protein [Anaerolineae bacterium]